MDAFRQIYATFLLVSHTDTLRLLLWHNWEHRFQNNVIIGAARGGFFVWFWGTCYCCNVVLWIFSFFFCKWFMNVSVIISFLLKKLCFLKKLQHVRLKCKYPLQGSNKFCATKSLWFLHLITSHWIIIILFLLVSRTQSSILVLHLIKSASFAARLVVK